MRYLPLVCAVMLLDCARPSGTRPFPQDEDTSIVFPRFYESFPVVVGEKGLPYELDGVTLRAITIAANDFIPSDGKQRPCWQTKEAHNYRVIRQGDIIFVEISWNSRNCQINFGILDGGVKYAISTDGRILRRLFDGEPERPSVPEPLDAGTQEFKGTEVPLSSVGKVYGEVLPNALPPGWWDGGGGPQPAGPDGGTVPDGGSSGLTASPPPGLPR